MVIRIKDTSQVPIYLQLRNQIVTGISDGRLRPGEALPTVRALAAEIGINAMTVNKSYQMLRQEGFIEIDRRHGARVREKNADAPQLSQVALEQLKALASEAKARGMEKAAFLALCDQAYGEEEVE